MHSPKKFPITTTIFIGVAAILYSLNLHAQIQFEQVILPPPAPQNVADFTAVSNCSTAFADVDGDLDQDLLITGRRISGTGGASSTAISELYINDGNGNFSLAANSLFQGVENSSIAFADIDGDMDQDVLITGDSDIGRISQLYINDGNGNFSLMDDTPFTGVDESSIAFADIDDDTDMDVMITGESNFGRISVLYTNDGNGNFSLMNNTPFSGVYESSIAFADVDGDLDQDVLITGNKNWSDNGLIATLYINDGNGNFTLMPNSTLAGVYRGSVAFSDVDGDMDQDLLITGSDNNSENISELYINDGSGNFSLMDNTPFTGFYHSSIAFADIDGDLDQDVLLTGASDWGTVTELYINNGFGSFSLVTNSPFADVFISSVAFADIDNDLDLDVFIPGYSISGRVSELYMNDGFGTFYKVIDSPFIGASHGSISFADIDGDMDQDILITGDSNSGLLADLYINNGNGVFSLVANTPFTPVYYSDVKFADVDGDMDLDVLIAGHHDVFLSSTELYINDGNGNFSLMENTPFVDAYRSSIAFADVDGDLDQDVLITGMSRSNSSRRSELYINDGSGNFTLIDNTPFTGVDQSSIAFADIDGDLDQDVLITGSFDYYFNKITELYTNDGAGNFSLVLNTNFENVTSGSIAFADIDGDSDQDVLITGQGSSTMLYLNDGNGIFSAEFFGDPNLVQSSIAFVDVDGDLDQDILMTGLSHAGPVAELHENDGEGNFTLVGDMPFAGVFESSIAFADIDGNNVKDVAIMGISQYGLVSRLYRNTTSSACQIDANCRTYMFALDETGSAIIQPSDLDNGSVVACGTASLSISQSTFTCTDVGVQNIELTVTDSNGNFEVCTAEVVIFPSNPCFDCNEAVILECAETDETYTYDESIPTNSIFQESCLTDPETDLLRDLWFSFSSDGNSEYAFQAANANQGLIVYSGTCGNLDIYDCAESQDNISADWSGTAMPEGEYFIRVLHIVSDGNNDTSIDFECINVIPDPNILEFVLNPINGCEYLPALVKFYEPGTSNLLHTREVGFNSSEAYVLFNPPIGIFDVFIKPFGSLQESYSQVEILEGLNSFALPALTMGDLDNSNTINILDVSILLSSFNSTVGTPQFNILADFNCTGSINITDFSILAINYNQTGDFPSLGQ